MIGGQDTVIRTGMAQALTVACRAARLRWPGLVIEDAGTGDRFRFRDAPLGTIGEALLYRDAAAAAAWSAGGQPRGTMIHALPRRGTDITLVTDSPPTGDVAEILDMIRSALKPARTWCFA